MVDDVDDQADEAIDEVLPRPGLPLQATFQQVAIDSRINPRDCSPTTTDSKLDWAKKQAWNPRQGAHSTPCGVDVRGARDYDFTWFGPRFGGRK